MFPSKISSSSTMTQRISTASVLLSVFLTGCAVLDQEKAKINSFSTKYVEPTGQERARLRLVSGGMTRLIPNATCVRWDVPGAGVATSRSIWQGKPDSFNDRSLGIPPGVKSETTGEVYIQAEKPIVIFANEGNHYIGITFIPKSDFDYELRITCDRRACYALNSALNDASSVKPLFVPVPFTVTGDCR